MDESSKSADEKKAARSSAIEEQILQAQKRKDERAFLEELAKRIQVAREGRLHSERREFNKAISAYRRFLSITARASNVSWDQLDPKMIDEKIRSSECLLISQILFDMMKILDKIDGPNAEEERKNCHRLFIRFTLNQNFQNYAAENLRKFVIYRKTVKHKKEFWATYNAIRSKKFCVVATWAFEDEDHPAVESLRYFRDTRLSQSPLGLRFIDWYYRNGETLVSMLKPISFAKPVFRAFLGYFAKRI